MKLTRRGLFGLGLGSMLAGLFGREKVQTAKQTTAAEVWEGSRSLTYSSQSFTFDLPASITITSITVVNDKRIIYYRPKA